MADNVTLNLGSGGALAAAREISHGGDTAQLQGIFIMGITGTEGSYTAAAINGDATNGLDVDITRANFTNAVDTAAGATQTGIHALGVRDDALATLTEADGDATLLRTNARGAQWVCLDSTVAQTVTLAAGTATNEVVGDVAHDAPAAGNPLLMAGYAQATAPTDVSGDADAVRIWCLRNGAQATVITAAGALIGGDATNGLDVDVTRVIPGTSATHLGKAVDSPAGSTDTGVAGLYVRDDALSGLTPAEGDYVYGRVDGNGAIWVRASNGIAGIVDDAAFTPATSELLPVGFFADETATDSIDEGDLGAARMTLDRKQIMTPYVHAAAGGQSPYKSLDLDETEEEIKASAGKIFWIHCVNMTATAKYLKFYNATAANVTVGTTTPVLTMVIPSNGGTTGAGFTIHFGDAGLGFSTAICAAVTTGAADNDTGAPGTGDVIFNCGYI